MQTENGGWADNASGTQGTKKKTKCGSSFAAAYTQAEKNTLLGVILVRDNPYQVLSRVESARLQKLSATK